ncbi:BTAD domain-containing putative transcriptional regulator [Actinoplanes sp. CA-252034]|uniref:BTAD domain-containing putative transcriptional regulator n=1 Tax=Actinoplanes sp. CA-252034 TaxID=3239906 RepID=UPI003D9542C8
MEVRDGDRVVPLGGTKQRAALGLLLLCANKVVATSKLLDALWPNDDAPASARKILQNAVCGLRNALARSDRTAGETALITQPPGYQLMVDPEEIDLFVFYRLVTEGRADLGQGRPDRAAAALRQALDMWRGPVLGDLVEIGISWPELTTVENARLDVMEDYFEAAMACGRQDEILRELETMVECHPLRERACRQLMLALYRNGRHVEALEVYARMRTALVDELGLDPGRDVRLLQQAILNHDPELAGAPVAAGEPPPPRPPVQPGPVRNTVSVLLVRGQTDAGSPSEQADALLDETSGLIHKTVRSFDGVPTISFGSMSMAVFEVGEAGDGPTRAVRAGLEIQRQLDAGKRMTQIAVATGKASVRSDPATNGWLTVRGSAVDKCQDLLTAAAGGELLVCPDTRRESESRFTFRRLSDESAGWLVNGMTEDLLSSHAVPLVDRESELAVLNGLLDRTGYRRRPHLVTVLGEPRIGKSRFLMEFERRIASQPQIVEYLVSRDPAGGLVVQGPSGSASRREEVSARLRELFDEPGPEPDEAGRMQRLWKEFLADTPLERPLIMVVDDLHRLPDPLLDFVEALAGFSGNVPLLVIGAARPELLQRRPDWSGGSPHSTTMTLDPLSDAALGQLLELLQGKLPGNDPALARRSFRAMTG